MKAPLPPDESQRLESLRRYAILDTPPEAPFEDLTLLAAQTCPTPIALVSLVDETRQLHSAELEQRVAERTASLTEANQEMEAFAYTISHDLRAPLRAIQGFAQALLEDCGDRLDGGGRDYARRIAAAGARLETLIVGRGSRFWIELEAAA